jgi:hypothetical protein
MHIASIGVDLGKTTFHLVALGEQGKVVVRKKFSRKQLLGLHRQPAELADWHRSLLGSTLHRRSSTQPGTRRARPVEELWNYVPILRKRYVKQSVGHRKGAPPRLYTPKDEQHLSDWLKRRLEDEIVASGIVIGHEVGIRRNVAAPGERTDIYVAAIKT